MGVVFGVFVCIKNKDLKVVVVFVIVIVLFGIIELVIYGVNLWLKKLMIYVVVSGVVGGVLMGWGGFYGIVFVN